MTAAAKRPPGGVRRDHRTLVAELGSLQQLATRSASDGPAPARLEKALARFLDEWGPRLAAHFEAEEHMVKPGVGLSVGAETWTCETFRHERETFEALLELLRDGRLWLERGEPGAEQEIRAALDDLSSVWGRHVRRMDVLGPLVSTEGTVPDA